MILAFLRIKQRSKQHSVQAYGIGSSTTGLKLLSCN